MSYPPLAGSSPCRKMWVCDSIIPGSTVAFDRSMTLAPAGTFTLPRIADRLDLLPANHDHLIVLWFVGARIDQRPSANHGYLDCSRVTQSAQHRRAGQQHERTSNDAYSLLFMAVHAPLDDSESSSLQFRGDDGVRLDLHQHLGRDHRHHLQHRRCGTNVAEHLAMRPRHFLPAADVGYEHPRAHHIAQARSRLQSAPAQCSSASAPPGRTYRFRPRSFRRACGHRSRHRTNGPTLHRARKSYFRFIRRIA